MRDWNQRGVRRAEGGYWYTRNLRALLLNPRVAGLRRWEGVLYEAEWEPILDRETWDRVCLRLEQRLPNPHRGRRGPPPTTYLLTGGVAFCECGKRLRSKPIRDHKRGYICDPMFEGCGRHRLAEPLENFVRDVVLKAFDAPNRGGRLRRALDRTQADDTGLMALLTEERALKAKRTQLEEDDVHDRIPHEQFLRMNDQVNRRLAEIEQEKYSRPVVTGLPVEIPAGLEASRIAWQTWTIDERRAVIAFALIKVTVKAAGKGRKVFDPSHVIFDWRV